MGHSILVIAANAVDDKRAAASFRARVKLSPSARSGAPTTRSPSATPSISPDLTTLQIVSGAKISG
jgi:hypothetical protein